MIQQAIVSHLNADVTLSALINGIWPGVIPQGESAPGVVYTLEDDIRDRLLGGTEGSYNIAIIEFNCYALVYGDAIAIADALQSALIDYRGQLGVTTPAVMADHIRLDRRLPDEYESDTDYRRISLQLFIGYTVS